MIIYSRKPNGSYTIIGSFRDNTPAQVEVLIDDGSTKLDGVFDPGDARNLIEKLIDQGSTVLKYTIVAVDPPKKS